VSGCDRYGGRNHLATIVWGLVALAGLVLIVIGALT